MSGLCLIPLFYGSGEKKSEIEERSAEESQRRVAVSRIDCV